MRYYTISTGRSRTETQWTARPISWSRLTDRLSCVTRTPETMAAYKTMSKADKGRVKDVGGFVGGALREDGRRKASMVQSRSLVTLDIDFGAPDTIGIVQDALAGLAWCIYSTHSHSDEAPRYRLIIPLDRDVTPDEYVAISRRVADDIGIDLFDDSTYEPVRLMYWPSASADAPFVFKKADGDELQADAVLASYTDWRNVAEWPVSSRVQRVTASNGRKQADPTLKEGIIGAFCRAYSVSDAIAAFLSDVYEPTDQEDRYTFKGGSTACGLVTYEDKWAYSHHGTDPASEQLCNAFDLVRIHRFGDLDEDSAPDTPVNRLPSFSAMADFAGKDRKVRMIQSSEAMSVAGDFAQEAGEDGGAWLAELEWNDRKGKPKQLANTPRNYRLVLQNHERYKNALAMDDFSHNRVITKPIEGHYPGEFWTDNDDLAVVQFFADPPFFAQGKQNIIDTVRYVTLENHFHPVKQYLEGLPAWDGVPRLDTLIIDYLGAGDNELNRALTRKHFCAAVRRIYHPGCKHDGVLSLDGPQGIGKSTLIAKMFGEWFSDTSINVDKTNESGMQMQGIWGYELAELTDYKKSTVEQYKAFISSCSDRVRIPYDRSYQDFPRQCVLFATTNDSNFLKGDTGNRRFWIIPVGEDICVKDIWKDLDVERDQIWAEALAKYKTEDPDLNSELTKELYNRQTRHNEFADDGRVDIIRSFMEDLVPSDWRKLPVGYRREWMETKTVRGIERTDLIQRPPVCYMEVELECLKLRDSSYNKKIVRSLMHYVGVVECESARDEVYKKQQRYRLMTYEERVEAGLEDGKKGKFPGASKMENFPDGKAVTKK